MSGLGICMNSHGAPYIYVPRSLPHAHAYTYAYALGMQGGARSAPLCIVVKVNQLSYNLSGSALVQFELNSYFGGLMRDARLHL